MSRFRISITDEMLHLPSYRAMEYVKLTCFGTEGGEVYEWRNEMKASWEFAGDWPEHKIQLLAAVAQGQLASYLELAGIDLSSV